jgi:hypothetical protein
MKLKEYIKELEELLDEHGDLDLYAASDDEGNSYNKVGFSPGIRYLPPDEVGSYRLDYLLDEDGVADEDGELEDYVKVALIN